MSKKKIILLLVLCVLLIVAPFFVARNGEFAGSDDLAEENIEKISGGDYKPWAHHLFEPPSGEVESFLFAFQAAAGAGFIGYFIGKKSKVKC